MKRKILGIPIALFVVGILFIGGVSAALVSYLSNTSTGSVEVKSPVLLKGADDESPLVQEWIGGGGNVLPAEENFSEGAGSLDLSATSYGGNTESFWIKAENLADVEIVSNLVFEVTCDTGINVSGESVGDFNATMTTYDEKSNGTREVRGGYDVETVLIPSGSISMVQINENTVRFYGETSLYGTGQFGSYDYVHIDLIFDPYAKGNYTIKVGYLKDPETGVFQ